MKILPLGRSVYLSCAEIIDTLPEAQGEPIFISLHITEEFSADYTLRAERVCRALKEKGYKIIADVSVKTKEIFKTDDLPALAERLGIYALRVDYGLGSEEICRIASKMPLAVNASTLSLSEAEKYASAGREVIAIHNFYPRPETGLDRAQFDRKTKALQALGYKVFAFIAGDETLRGPVFEGLPTIESQRSLNPSAAYMQLCAQEACDGVIVGDPGLSRAEEEKIALFRQQGTGDIVLQCELDSRFSHFIGVTLTSREDSPAGLIRVKQSRGYAVKGAEIEPENCVERERGAICIDNSRYGRYSGELMIARDSYPADGRVNVIGHIDPQSIGLLELIGNGESFILKQQ